MNLLINSLLLPLLPSSNPRSSIVRFPYRNRSYYFLTFLFRFLSFHYWLSTEKKSYAVLVDISVRSLADLDEAMDKFPFWKKVILNLRALRSSFSGIRSCFSHVPDSRQHSQAVSLRLLKSFY